jgi:hypothetical protein
MFAKEQVVAGSTVKMIALLAATSFAASAPASAAFQVQGTQASVISPWVALSALGSTGSGAALCANAATAAAAAGQAGNVGCVLPLVDAPVAAPIAGAAPLPVAVAAPGAAGGLSFLPILLGLAAVAAGVALLAGKGNGNDDIDLPPISPA